MSQETVKYIPVTLRDVAHPRFLDWLKQVLPPSEHPKNQADAFFIRELFKFTNHLQISPNSRSYSFGEGMPSFEYVNDDLLWVKALQ